MNAPKGITAIVELTRGERKLDSFIKNAGLGIDGVGVKERLTITYKVGEVVDEARVLKAINSMIEQSDAQKTNFVLSNPRVLSIT
jgi:hypothetical protein